MWKNKFEEFIYWKDVDGKFVVDPDYLMGFWDLFPNLVPIKKTEKGYGGERQRIKEEIQRYKEKGDEYNVRKKIVEFLETIVNQTMEEGLTSFTWPTIITEPNLNMAGEGDEKVEEIWRILYLIYSGVKFGTYIINIDNVSDRGRKWIWETLVTSTTIMGRKGPDFKPIMEKLKVKFMPNSEPFFATLALLGFWAYKAAEEREKKDMGNMLEPWEKIIMERFSRDLGWSENTALIMFGRETKGVYYMFPQSINLVRLWLNPENNLLQFLSSTVNISDKQLREVAIRKREMLAYYLLRHQQINGEILSHLVAMKCSAELKKTRGVYGITGAKPFFAIL